MNDEDEPMDESQLVNGFEGQDTLGHVKPSHVLAKGVVLDQHRHQVTTG